MDLSEIPPGDVSFDFRSVLVRTPSRKLPASSTEPELKNCRKESKDEGMFLNPF
jgi:hypothetical protein